MVIFECKDCAADWAGDHMVGNHSCLSCNGTGQSKHGNPIKSPCGDCRGTGTILNKMAYVGCPRCYSRNIKQVEDDDGGQKS